MQYNLAMTPREPHHTSDSLLMTCLGSGSAGNSIAVHAPEGLILVDVGFSAREIVRRLEANGLDPTSVRAIVVTHEHGDHVRGVRVLAKRLSVPVWGSHGTLRAARLLQECAECNVLVQGEPTSIAGVQVIAFRTSHDTVEPVGVRIEGASDVATILTDTGEVTDEAREALAGSTLIGIECNHDVDMLSNGPYPWFLKQRILSTRGHLSNEDAAIALIAACDDALTTAYALHLSETNNTTRLANVSLRRALEREGHPASVVTVGQGGVLG